MRGHSCARLFVAAVVTGLAFGRADAFASGPEPPSLSDLERQVAAAPNDLELRSRVMDAYFLERSPDARAARASHVLWVIGNAPDSWLAGRPEAQLHRYREPKQYQKGKDLWLSHLEKEPVPPAVLYNAAMYFYTEEKDRAAELLKRGMELEPTQRRWKEQLAHLMTLDESVGSGPAGDALALRESALADTQGEIERFHALEELAETALQAGEDGKARAYAEELLALSERRPSYQNGDAIHEGNRVLGHLALRAGDVEGAKEFLLKSGATSGSPVLNSFGPDLTLARDLLAKGERETVIQYLEMCRRFWLRTDAQLSEWITQIRAGGRPDLNRFRAKRTEPTASR